MTVDWYNKTGQAISLEEAGKLLQDRSYKVIAQTALWNGYWVSTIWLGLDHSWMGGERLIFETMVFYRGIGWKIKGWSLERHHRWMDLWMKRYSTEEEALKGHREAVRKFTYRLPRVIS